jgi:hypothetical protein
LNYILNQDLQDFRKRRIGFFKPLSGEIMIAKTIPLAHNPASEKFGHKKTLKEILRVLIISWRQPTLPPVKAVPSALTGLNFSVRNGKR